MSLAVVELLAPFRAIELGALEAKASMLERLDNKYVLSTSILEETLTELAPDFDVLEVDGRRLFTYDTCYFDDAQLRSYHDHHQGRRRRMKVRMRRYCDTGMCFVEVKLKDRRGATLKRRLRCPYDSFGRLDAAALAHIESSYRALYGEPFERHLEPVLSMRYRRATLVARAGGERVTIDCDLQFLAAGGGQGTGGDSFIVEAKSANGNGLADAVLRRLHQHTTNGCSKYCVGMSLTGEVGHFNRFRPVLRKLGALPSPRRDLAHAL